MKKRIWIKRKDRVRQRYWVGRSRKKNYGAFKFVSPWQQLKETTKINPRTGEIVPGTIEPDYARFGTGKLKVGDEREMLRLQKELSALQKSKEEREKLIKDIEIPPKVKFEEEQPKKKVNPEGKFIIELKKKIEETTPEKIIKRHESSAAELRKREKEEIKERFISEKGLSPEVSSIALQKYEALYKQDPKGRSIGLDYMFNRAARLALNESKGKQKVIPGVKTYQDQDYINEFKKLGYSQKDAENEFFKIPSDVSMGKTPQELVKIIEKIPQVKFTEGELLDTSKIIPLSSEEASKILDDLLQFRPDLQKENRGKLLSKLKTDIRETGHVPVSTLRDFFNIDKPLKEALEDEQEQ